MPESATATGTLARPFDVAVLLGLSTQTVTDRAARGDLPGAVYIGRTLRFDMNKVRSFIDHGGQRKCADPVTLKPSQRNVRTLALVRVRRRASPLAADDSITTVKAKPGAHGLQSSGMVYGHRWSDEGGSVDEDRECAE